MRVIKGLVLFCFSMMAVSACFNPPEFSDIPKLEYQDIRFKEIGGAAQDDSLILYLDFTDGNGDLGLTDEDDDDEIFYYMYDGTGDTFRITSSLRDKYTVLNTGAHTGKIVIDKTRLLPNYGFLPPYDPSSCYNYVATNFLLAPLTAVDATYDYTVVTLPGTTEEYAMIANPVLFINNPLFNNLEIKFYQFQGGGFVEYDWFQQSSSCLSYNARFSTTNSQTPEYKNRPIEGTIRYGMVGSFINVFGSNQIKLSARIRDRAGNTSNLVFTKEFDLDEIR
jgi:hypothetical protein